MLIVRAITAKATQIVSEHTHSFSYSNKAIPAISTSSIFLVHSSTNLSTNFFLHLQFSYFKYSPTSHDLSHSHSQLLGFQIDSLLHTPLSINYSHSHLHLSSFQRCLLLQTLPSNLHLHLHVSCYSVCLVLLVLNTEIFNNIRNTQLYIWIIDIVAIITAFTCFNAKGKKHRFILIKINNL